MGLVVSGVGCCGVGFNSNSREEPGVWGRWWVLLLCNLSDSSGRIHRNVFRSTVTRVHRTTIATEGEG